MNKLVDKYSKLIKSNKMTKVEINSMRKALGNCSSLNRDEKKVILDTLYTQIDKSGGIKITKEHTIQGLNFLKSIAWTKTGKISERKDNPFGFRERAILSKFTEFRLVGLDEGFNGMGEVMYYASIWAVKANDATFEYVQHGHWGVVQVIR